MRQSRFARYKSTLIWLLSILLLLSIGLNFLAVSAATDYYRQAYEAILDPIGLRYFRNETNALPVGERIAVFYGDSRAANWTSPQLNGYYFVNRGIGNQTSAQVLLRFEEHIQPLQPEIVILQVCINDLKTIPLFPRRKEEIISGCKSNIDTIVQKSLDLDAHVILTTIFPTSGKVPLARQLVWSDDVYKSIAEINDFIRAHIKDSITIFDAAEILANSENHTRSDYVFDLLHLNTEGYTALNVQLVKVLEELKQKSR